MENQKKISLPEIVIMVLIVGAAEFFDLFVAFSAAVPVVGQVLVFVNEFINFFIMAIIQLWLLIRGGIGFKPQATALAGNLIDLIPILNALPARLITLVIAIMIINNPKAGQIASLGKKAIK